MEIKCYTKDDILKKQEEVKDVNKIKSIIRKLTDINKNPNDKQDIYYVDVNLPVPILKVRYTTYTIQKSTGCNSFMSCIGSESISYK